MLVLREGSSPVLSNRSTLPETNIFAPKFGWLEDEFRFGIAYFQGLC